MFALTILAASSLLPSAPRAVPAASPTVLSVFHQPAPGACNWLRVDPVQGRRDLVTRLPRDCAGVSAAWSPDGARAIVEFPGPWSAEDGPTRDAWLVDVTRLPATVERLELPESAGHLDVLAFDTDGAPVALYLEVPNDVQRRTFVHRGRSYTVPKFLPGAPALAHAWRLEGERWRNTETVATTVEACGAPGTLRLESAGRLAPTTARMLDPAWGHDLSPDPIDVDLSDALASHERIDAESDHSWVRLKTERSAVIAVEGGFEYAFLTTPLLLVDDDGVHELEGIVENAVLAAESRGRYFLVSEAVSGARPRLYDLDGGRLLYAPRDVSAVTFWP